MSKIKTARTVLKAAYNVWQKLPAKQRKQLLRAVKTHGPNLAKKAVKARRGLKK